MNDQQANALFEQSIALLQQGNAQEALKLLTKLDQAIPSNPGILYFTATGYSITGNKHKAIQTYERVLRLNPQFIEAYNNIALDLAYLGEHQKAISYFDNALNIRPDFTDARLNKGCSLNELGAVREALACFEQILNDTPDHSAALANATTSYIKLGDYGRAQELAHYALSMNQFDYMAYQNLGNISLKEESPELALDYFKSALTINPNNLDALSGAGLAHLELGDYATAQSCFENVLKINSNHGQTYNNLGLLHHETRDFDKAIGFYSHPTQNKKRIGNREYNRSLSYLHANNFRLGWRDYGWRWKEATLPTPYHSTQNQLWDGQDTDQPVLIWHEQGIGDQILFGTLLVEAAARAPKLIVRLDERLVPLFQRSFPSIRFIPHNHPISDADFEYHFPIGDLARLFRNTIGDFDRQPSSYLVADSTRAKALHELLNSRIPTIGLTWATKGQRAKERNLPIVALVELIQNTLPSTLLDLQYSDTTHDRDRIAQNLAVTIQRLDEIDNFQDLDGLAALISACDLVITCSNSTAHLAGALGKETYLLVPFSRGRHWYWSHIRENGRSMWYPSIRVIPQTAMGDWSGPLSTLQNYLNNRTKPDSPSTV